MTLQPASRLKRVPDETAADERIGKKHEKTYETPSDEIVLRDVEHIFTMISGGTGDIGNIESVDFNDIQFS